jgi:ribosomal protein L7/L12
MLWRVVVSGDEPDEQAVSALCELTGLGRGEVVLSLRRGDLIAGTGFKLERARELALKLGSDFKLAARVVPLTEDASTSAQQYFKVVLTGYRPGSRARLRGQLEKLSGLPPEQVALWLSKIPFVLRRGVDHDTARLIKRRIQSGGGLAELRPDTPSPSRTGGGHSPSPPAPSAAKVTATGPTSVVSTLAESQSVSGPPPPETTEIPPVIVKASKGSRTGATPHVFSFSPPPRAEDFDFDPPQKPVFRSEPPHCFEFLPPEVESGAVPPLLGPVGKRPPVSSRNARRSGARRSASPVTSPSSDAIREKAPSVFRAVLHQPSSGEREGVVKAIRDRMGIGQSEAAGMVESCPVVLSSFENLPDLVSWTRELEEAGATISVLAGDASLDESEERGEGLLPGESEKTAGESGPYGFLGWLTGCWE